MIDRIDILSFCRILIDLTNKDKCKWSPSPHNSRDHLDFDSGSIEITQYQETENTKKSYYIDIYNSIDDFRFPPFIAEKNDGGEQYKVFGDLYKAIWAYYERIRDEKITSFLNEILEQSSK